MDVVERISRLKNVDEFESSIGDILLTLGFDFWVYTVKMPNSFEGNPLELEVFHNWTSREFVERYATIHAGNCYKFDHLWKMETPIIYDDKFIDRDIKMIKMLKPESAAVIQEEIDFGFQGYGFSLSTHGKYGEKGVLTLSNGGSNGGGRRKDGIDAISISFPLASAFFPFMHMKYIELKGWTPPGGLFLLTDRELECLRWAAGGKSAWETGMILDISERTVIFHLANAQKKLMATNKIQAVARAVLYNLL